MATLGDKAVLVTCIGGWLFVAGMLVGEYKTRHALATVCEPQPGATLVSAYQDAHGVLCVYLDKPPTARALRRLVAGTKS